MKSALHHDDAFGMSCSRFSLCRKQQVGGQHAAFAPPILILTPIGIQVVVGKLKGASIHLLVAYAYGDPSLLRRTQCVRRSMLMISHPFGNPVSPASFPVGHGLGRPIALTNSNIIFLIANSVWRPSSRSQEFTIPWAIRIPRSCTQ